MSRIQFSGGLAWHWQAWRSLSKWKPTTELISQWLTQVNVHRHHATLVLVGSSAGWMMASQWLCQFKEIKIFDIDPLAAPLFKWRHGKSLSDSGTQLTCFKTDALANLTSILTANPSAFIFFDNLLGQLRFMHPSPDATEIELQKLMRQLKGRSWGSLHDRMSGKVHPSSSTNASMSSQIVKGHFKKDLEIQAWLNSMQAQSPWLDHLTQDIFPEDTEVQNFKWAFNDQYWHWLQAGWVNPK